MAAHLISAPSLRRSASWAGRASQHRRQQVSRELEAARVHSLWESLVEVLRAIESPSSALLCTSDGYPVAAFGLPRVDLPKASLETGTAFAARTVPADPAGHTAAGEVEIVELTAGRRHTVIASVPGTDQTDHLLAVTAEGVSLPLLHAWTRRAAEDLSEVLAAEAS